MTLKEKLEQARIKVEHMSAEEKQKMYEEQRRSFVRSVTEWPKPKFKWVAGVKVYESYEDYVND